MSWFNEPHQIAISDFNEKFDLLMASASSSNRSLADAFRKTLVLTAVSREYVVRRRYNILSRNLNESLNGEEIIRTVNLSDAIECYNNWG